MVSVLFTTKSYFSCLVAELSQLCYISVIRSVALGSTDGLCTWICIYLLGLQPVIVPAGRISLGRIFNVLGATIDRYLGLSLSSQFNTLLLIYMGFGQCIESHEQYAYALCYLGTKTLCSTNMYYSSASVTPNLIAIDYKLFWYHLLVNTYQYSSNLHSWLFYSVNILHLTNCC